MIVNGTLIDNRFEILDTIGVGGFGTVVKARQVQFDRLVAIKLLKTTLLDEPDGLPRFEREAKAINALKHKNIVAFYGYGDWCNAPYMVMELVEGKSLEALMSAGNIEPRRALRIIAQVFEALDFAHRHGVVHRDLKPSNIMIVNDEFGSEVVKIIDFGLAKLMPSYGIPGQKLTETGYVLGTCLYMAPEQALGMPVDQRADIYSAGCILQYALTGKLPFDGPDNVAIMLKHLNDPPPPLAQLPGASEQTAALQILIDNCLAKDAADRYPDGAEAARYALLLANGSYDSVSKLSKKSTLFGKAVKQATGPGKALVATASAAAVITIALCLTYSGKLGTNNQSLEPIKDKRSVELASQLNKKLDLSTIRRAKQSTVDKELTLEAAMLAAKAQPDSCVRQAIIWSRSSQLIELFINQHRFKEATKVGVWLRKELGQNEMYAWPGLILIGNVELAKGNYESAEKNFRQALKTNGSVEAWGWLGLARVELYRQHFQLAAEYANKALLANSQQVGENQVSTFHTEYAYPILTSAAAAQKKRACVESLIHEYSDSVVYGAPLAPAEFNSIDMSITTTMLNKAGFADLVPQLTRTTRRTYGLGNPIRAR